MRRIRAQEYEVNACLRPGRKGTGRLVEKYCTSLLCVRYRYDEKRGVQLKTVQIILQKLSHTPSLRHSDADIISVMVPFTARGLREALKAAGRRWRPEERLWRAPCGFIRSNAGLVERMVRD